MSRMGMYQELIDDGYSNGYQDGYKKAMAEMAIELTKIVEQMKEYEKK